MYNPSSNKAGEFISHEEIMETLAYAEANKNNEELIDKIIGKAKLKKGLNHREASVLLACEIPPKSTNWQGRLKKTSTETGSSCLRRSIFLITVSTDASNVLIT